MITVGYFWHGLIHGGTTFMYLKYSRPLYIFTNVWKGSYTISASIFVDLRYLPPYSTNKFFSCVVSGPSQWSFHFGEEIVFAWTRRKRWQLVVTEPQHSPWQCMELHRCAVTDRLRRWQWEILEHPPYSPDMSPCDYDLFVKVKESLRGTRYNTRDKLVRAIRRSIWNIKKDGRADGVTPSIHLAEGINKGGDYIKCTQRLYPCE